MKHLTIVLAALGLSTVALAALPAATDPTIVTVPQLPGGFVIGGSGLYLEPSDSNGDLDFFSSINSQTGTSFSSLRQSVQPGYDWGWGINIGYIFPNTGNDVNLSYFNFRSSDNNSATQFIPAIPAIFPGAQEILTGTAKYNLDQVDLTVGQYIDVGCRLTLHPNVGLRWADLKRKLSEALAATASTVTLRETISEKNDFDGIGPIAGIDGSYYLTNGFGIVGHFDSALLVGNINSNANAFVADPGLPLFSSAENSNNQQRIVPVVDSKLGVNYTYLFNNAANSDLTLEAGWQFSEYYNAVDKLSISPTVITGRFTSNVALEGPYISLVLHI